MYLFWNKSHYVALAVLELAYVDLAGFQLTESCLLLWGLEACTTVPHFGEGM